MTAGNRTLAVLAELSAGGATEPAPMRLCEVCASVTAMSGAGITLMSDEIQPSRSICASGPVSAALADLQFTLGEGPAIDAYQTGRGVLEPDLIHLAGPRWPAFARGAVDAGAGAVFAFPMQVGAVRLGAVTLHRDRPGRLTDDQHSDAIVVANVAAHAVVALQAGAPLGVLAEDLATGGGPPLVVHQATGMVAAQLDVSVSDALVRLRARAFRSERRLADVATDIVRRRLRFDDLDASTER